MLDKKYLEAYQNISAPPELKEKVMARAEEKAAEPSFIVRFGKKTKALSALAACLVCVIAFSVFWGNANAPTVFVGEQKVGSALVALADDGIAMAAMPRLMPKVSLEMNVQLKEETTVSISEGVMNIVDAQTGFVLAEQVREYLGEGELDIFWEVDEAVANGAELFLDGTRHSKVFQISGNETAEGWFINCIKK